MSSLLSQLKVSLTSLSFLPTGAADPKELTVARNTLEIGAKFAVAEGDIPMFERYMAQLQTYYYDYTSLAESDFKCELLGLNLLCLLSQNKVAEFHTELERLSSKELESVYIRHPVSMEQYIMEGSYNKVINLKGNVPAESYNFFFDILLKTVRNEIASCLEKVSFSCDSMLISSFYSMPGLQRYPACGRCSNAQLVRGRHDRPGLGARLAHRGRQVRVPRPGGGQQGPGGRRAQPRPGQDGHLLRPGDGADRLVA